MATRSAELRMLDLFRLHFFGSRRSGRSDVSQLSPNQAFVLSELVRRKCPSLEELRSVLKLHVSSLSRAISHLSAIGMVSSRKDPEDSRRLLTEPTPKGIALAEQFRLMQQETIDSRLQNFSTEERIALEKFLRIFAGEEAYQRIVPVRDEPEIAIISKALTYDHGVVSDNYLESGYSVLDWIILSEIHYERRQPGELARLCGVAPSTLSLRLKTLQEQGLFSVSKGAHDRRARTLELLTKGKHELRAIEEAASKYFSRTLRSMPPADLERGLTLFRRYVVELTGDLTTRYQIQRVARSTLDSLRRSLLRPLDTLGELYPLSATLLHPENQIFRITSDSNPLLVLECELMETGDFRLINSIPLSGESRLPSSDALVSLLQEHLGAPLRVPQPLKRYIDTLQAQ